MPGLDYLQPILSRCREGIVSVDVYGGKTQIITIPTIYVRSTTVLYDMNGITNNILTLRSPKATIVAFKLYNAVVKEPFVLSK